jgi:hypothetical protein
MPFEVPPVDLTTTVIEAVNLILQALGISPLDLILGLFSGKPKFEDTDTLIAGYAASQYWPLQALGANLAIAARNGAPISDSNPAIQAQFGVWKQGTVTSIQTLAGVQVGPTGPGYWTIFHLIEQTWAASGEGINNVLTLVRTLDALTKVLMDQKPVLPPPTPPPAPTFPNVWPFPIPAPCFPAVDPNGDELTQGFACLAENGATLAYLAWLIYQLLTAMNTPPPPPVVPPIVPPPPPVDQTCCDNVVAAINAEATAVATAGDAVAKAIASASGAAPVDLTPLVDAVNGLTTTGDALEKCLCAWLQNDLTQGAAIDAQSKSSLAYFSGLGLVDAPLDQVLSS